MLFWVDFMAQIELTVFFRNLFIEITSISNVSVQSTENEVYS
jgi:hypothetical protein